MVIEDFNQYSPWNHKSTDPADHLPDLADRLRVAPTSRAD